MTFKPTVLALALIVAGILSTPAKAVTVNNGGFETDICPCANGIVPNGWNAGPLWDSGDNGGLDGLTNAVLTVHSGRNALQIGAVSSVGFANIFQDLTTTPGSSYTIDFWAQSSGASSSNYLKVSAANGSVILGSLTLNGDIGSYQEFNFGFTATGLDTTLSVGGINDPAFYYVDDVSITADSTPAVPEGSTWVLVLTGFASIGLLIGYRRQRRTTFVAA